MARFEDMNYLIAWAVFSVVCNIENMNIPGNDNDCDMFLTIKIMCEYSQVPIGTCKVLRSQTYIRRYYDT